MKRTKEIDVWVEECVLNGDKDVMHEISKYRTSCSKPLKAKLIIEIPEKKVEITESQCEKAIDIAVGFLSESTRLNLRRCLGFKE